jgi:hypothetical protein
MQCGIHGKKVSSSEDDDFPLTDTAAAAAPGECAPFVPLKCTLPHAVAVRRTATMQCGIHGKKVSSSEDEDLIHTTTAAAAAPGVCLPAIK